MFYRAFIGPSLGGAFDEHFGFQWAMTVCTYSVIPRLKATSIALAIFLKRPFISHK